MCVDWDRLWAVNIRSTGKVFGGKQLVAFGFQSVGHDCSRKGRDMWVLE
jgi:hypothetical protein